MGYLLEVVRVTLTDDGSDDEEEHAKKGAIGELVSAGLGPVCLFAWRRLEVNGQLRRHPHTQSRRVAGGPGNTRQAARRRQDPFYGSLGSDARPRARAPRIALEDNPRRDPVLRDVAGFEIAEVRPHARPGAPYCDCDRCHERSGGSSDPAAHGPGRVRARTSVSVLTWLLDSRLTDSTPRANSFVVAAPPEFVYSFRSVVF